MGYAHPGWFLAKSAETIERKRVAFLVRAKKCKKVQKSAQGFENKGDRGQGDRLLGCWKVGMLKGGMLRVPTGSGSSIES